MQESGYVARSDSEGVATIEFGHPRGNSLPGAILNQLADAIILAGRDAQINCILLRSAGERVFCGGASFDELTTLKSRSEAHQFFMGFARVILAVRTCPIFVVARVQGKAVGGGVGLAAACDYALASHTASIKLSEFQLGFGPFVISPAVQRKVGLAAFSALTIDTEWRDAAWCQRTGLYASVHDSLEGLNGAVNDLTARLAGAHRAAATKIKSVLWAGTENWPELLSQRAMMSAELLETPFVQNALKAARAAS
jgi:methylglutaconyl-CoA hydratase